MFGSNVMRRLKGWQERRRLRNELQALDDRLLADIGLSRGDIEAVVAGGRGRSVVA
jgi:uncharacterized protein YjiS (DUF1127 family)